MNHAGVPRLKTDGVVPTVKLNLAAALAALLAELEPWRHDLPADIRHAQERGLFHLAVDLERLHQRVTRTQVCGRTLQRVLERPT